MSDPFPTVYRELRQIAARLLRQESRAHGTLQPTALVHEAWLKFARTRDGDVEEGADRDDVEAWQRGGRDAVRVVARAMRQVLVDHARARNAQKRKATLVSLDAGLGEVEGDGSGASTVDVLTLHEALERLAEEAPRPARIVELRFFAGLTVPAAAEVVGISRQAAEGDWYWARAWLRRELSAGEA